MYISFFTWAILCSYMHKSVFFFRFLEFHSLYTIFLIFLDGTPIYILFCSTFCFESNMFIFGVLHFFYFGIHQSNFFESDVKFLLISHSHASFQMRVWRRFQTWEISPGSIHGLGGGQGLTKSKCGLEAFVSTLTKSRNIQHTLSPQVKIPLRPCLMHSYLP